MTLTRTSAPEMRPAPAGSNAYVLGHSAPEQRRLDDQGAFLRPYTERLLRDAGLGPGMRVLDVGCGTGDVTVLAAEIVGPAGSVVGIDRSADVLETARRRAGARGLDGVRYVEGDIAALTPTTLGPEPFDAAVGRLVLMYQRDPVDVLRRVAALVRPAGVLAFADLVLLPPRVWPRRPVYERALGWIGQALERSGAMTDAGLRLHAMFAAAGLPAPEVRLDGVVVAGQDVAKFDWLVSTVRTLLPAIERLGVATAEDVGIETLAERLVREAAAAPGAVCGFGLGAAWGRTA